MASLADELLNDFEDSGSENGDRQNGFLDDEDALQGSGDDLKHERNGSMELDGDEEEIDEAEEEEAAAAWNSSQRVDVAGDEDEAKARVEKMDLTGVSDVRSVASLMKTLQPVLDVSLPQRPSSLTF